MVSKRNLWVAVVFAMAMALAMGVAACGSGSSSSSGTTSGDSSTAADPIVESAREALAEYSGESSKILVKEPLKTKPTGKRIDYLEASLPTAKLVGEKIDAGAKQLGLEVKHISIGGTPDTIAQGWTEAVQDEPDAILTIAFGPEFYPTQAKELAEAGVPIIGFGFAGCDELREPCPKGQESGVTVNTFGDPDAELYGKLMADEVIAVSNGTANAAYFGVPDFSLNKPLYGAFQKRLSECKGCSLDTQDVQIQDLGTNLPKQIVSYLQSHPDVEYLVPQYGDLITGVPEAMAAAGIEDVKIVSQSSGPASLQEIAEGGTQVADASNPYGYLAYLSLDLASRLMIGQELVKSEAHMPYKMTVEDNVENSDSGFWVGVKGYPEQFESIWGGS